MCSTSALPAFAAVVVAGGSGTRAQQGQPKQFALWRGRPVLTHAIERLHQAGAAPMAVVVPDPHSPQAQAIAAPFACVHLVKAGESRQESVRAGLEALAVHSDMPDHVLIHDAARPDVNPAVISRLCQALHMQSGAIPTLPVVDSLVKVENTMMGEPVDRATLQRVQTPQAFHFCDILAAHRQWQGPANAGDDAQVARAAGIKIALVAGDEALKKLTFAGDFAMQQPAMRVGNGYDVHRLGPTTDEHDALWLGGVKIPHNRTLIGHSDADVALHAVVDALLGAIAAGDIGQHFPPSEPRWKGAASACFVEHAASLVSAAGYTIANLDVTLVCEGPKIGPYREAMRDNLAKLLAIDVAQVSVKATTSERLGFTGRSEGIAAHATVCVMKE